MSDEGRERTDHQEEGNIARLVRAGFGPAARPGLPASEQAFRRLLAQLRARPAAVAFPDPIVVLLAGLLVLMAVWLGVQALGGNIAATTVPLLAVVAGLLAGNLALVPAASLVIVLRRRQAYLV